MFSINERVPAIWALLALPAVLLAVSAFGIYVFYKEEFTLKDGVFTYVKILKKPQSVNVESIDFVTIRKSGLLTKVQFINKKSETVLSFLDDGTAFEDGKFMSALDKLQIQVRFN